MPKKKSFIKQPEPISIGEAIRKLCEIFQEIDRDAVAKRKEYIEDLKTKIKSDKE